MSYFLFGSLRLSDRSLALSDKFALKLASAGADCRLYVLVGGNVWQKPVVDVLRDHHQLYADGSHPQGTTGRAWGYLVNQ